MTIFKVNEKAPPPLTPRDDSEFFSGVGLVLAALLRDLSNGDRVAEHIIIGFGFERQNFDSCDTYDRALIRRLFTKSPDLKGLNVKGKKEK